MENSYDISCFRRNCNILFLKKRIFSLELFQCACLVRVPVEIVKQRAQVNQNLSLTFIARSSIQNEVCFI
jgi:hypothetical protein